VCRKGNTSCSSCSMALFIMPRTQQPHQRPFWASWSQQLQRSKHFKIVFCS
jgi:hypothetical protein